MIEKTKPRRQPGHKFIGDKLSHKDTPRNRQSQGKYLRVGTTYYKIINDTYLKKWTRGTIAFDHGRNYLRTVPKYDDPYFLPEPFRSMEVRK
jgi:hypothetical protein